MVKNLDLYLELVTAVYGTDDEALALWLMQKAEDAGYSEFNRAAIHFQRCIEKERYAIWNALGLTEVSVERFPCPFLVAEDYRFALKKATTLLALQD